MKIGVSTAILEGHYDSLNELAENVKECGVDGIELNFDVWPSKINVNEVKDILETFELEVSAIGTRHMFLDFNIYLASPSPPIRKKAVTYIKECIKLSSSLGAKVVQNGWAFQGPKLEGKYEDVWKFAVESLNELAAFTEDYGITDAIEVINRYEAQLINTISQGLKFLKQLKKGNFKLNIDTFHMNIEEGSIKESILEAKESIGYIHIADNNRLAPGYGHFNFQELLYALKKIKYDSYLVMEYNLQNNINESLKDSATYLRHLLAA